MGKLSFAIFVGLMLVSIPATARADAMYVSSANASVTVVGMLLLATGLAGFAIKTRKRLKSR